MNMHRNMQALKEVGYQHMCVPDHAPGHKEPAAGRQAFAYEFGCIGLCPRRAFSGIVAPVPAPNQADQQLPAHLQAAPLAGQLESHSRGGDESSGAPAPPKKNQALDKTDSACPLCAYLILILWGTAHLLFHLAHPRADLRG